VVLSGEFQTVVVDTARHRKIKQVSKKAQELKAGFISGTVRRLAEMERNEA